MYFLISLCSHLFQDSRLSTFLKLINQLKAGDFCFGGLSRGCEKHFLFSTTIKNSAFSNIFLCHFNTRTRTKSDLIIKTCFLIEPVWSLFQKSFVETKKYHVPAFLNILYADLTSTFTNSYLLE